MSTEEIVDRPNEMDTYVQDVVEGGQHIEVEDGNEELNLKRWKTVLEAVHQDNIDLPKVTLQVATPLPDVTTNGDIPDEGSDGGAVEDEVEEEENEGAFDESDPDNTEMTPEEKRNVYEAVKSGDIDWLEDCLDKPNSDINMTWYKENMLMTAIRNGQQEMAEFLLDNGVDHTYTASVVNLNDTPKGKIFERYDVTCRQLAYDHDMLGIVEIIDSLQGKLFPFIRLEPRIPRFRRPKPATPSDSEGSGSEDADVSSGAEGCGEEAVIGGEAERKTHKRRTKRRDVKVDDDSEIRESDTVTLVDNKIIQPDQTFNDNQKSLNTNKLKESNIVELNMPLLITREAGQLAISKDQPTNEVKEPRAVTFSDELSQIKKQLTVKPRIGSPSTKAAMGVALSRHTYRRISSVDRVPSVEEHPTKWRKISTVGSYSRESRSWHVEHIPDPEYTEIIDLRPTSALSTSSSFSSMVSSSLPKYIHRSSFASTISDKNNYQAEDILPPKLKPEKPVPSYMKSTASSLTKKRLNPSFVNSYSALDFR